MSATRAFVDGLPADAAALLRFARAGYGHFTTMQVRAGAVRGLALHLARLEEATRMLFDATLDVAALRVQMRRALDGVADASLRISVAAANFTARAMPSPARIEVLILVDPPAPEIVAPVRLMGVAHSHYLPQIKHSGSFDLFHLRRRARALDFDDALLLTPEGFVAEGTTFNVGFFSGNALVWPQAAMLEGVTMRLLSGVFEAGVATLSTLLPPGEGARRADEGTRVSATAKPCGEVDYCAASVPSPQPLSRGERGLSRGEGGLSGTVIHRPVPLADITRFDGGFCCNTGGIWPIRSIDAHPLPCSEAATANLRRLLALIDGEPI